MTRDPRGVKVVPVCHPLGCRSYVVVDPTTREAAVVDPLLDRIADIVRVIGEHDASVRWIVDTHSHADHLSGAAALRERTGAEVVMHPTAPSAVATTRPDDGARLPLGEGALVVHHAPGNTADALVLEAPGTLFTGDTLLIGTVGLCDAPGSDATAWFESLRRIFADRPDATVLHPGHDDMGRTLTTLRQERTGNHWLREDDFEAFEARFASDDRPACEDAEEILAANREGLQRVPRDLAPASGLVDPAHATEAALRRTHAWERARPTPGTGPERPLAGILLIGGALVLLGTLLGFLVHDLFHTLSGLVGAVLIGLALRPGRRRTRKGEPSLFYEGPVRKTIGG